MSTAWLIVLNWNGRSDTLELLDDLEAADLADTTVLVVDNASSDNTLDAVHERHPWVRTLQTGANLGYAGGNNRGIDLALSSGASVVGVLNNDTRVGPGFWKPLVDEATRERSAVSPDIRYADRPDISWFRGGTIDRHLGWPRHLQPDEQSSLEMTFPTELLTGCCLVASADLWRDVGAFDESMFLIFEDSDWSMRSRAKGYALSVVPSSVIQHKVSASIEAAGSGIGVFYFCRNGLLFAHRWLGVRGVLNFLGKVVLGEAVRCRSLIPLIGAIAALLRRYGQAPRILTHLP